eukprot:4173513-Pyramimonas_sp.AAC.1
MTDVVSTSEVDDVLALSSSVVYVSVVDGFVALVCETRNVCEDWQGFARCVVVQALFHFLHINRFSDPFPLISVEVSVPPISNIFEAVITRFLMFHKHYGSYLPTNT